MEHTSSEGKRCEIYYGIHYSRYATVFSERPRRVQKLVSADVMNPCPNFGAGSTSYWTPRPVAVKVCTRKEMRRTCPPKLCDCPQKVQAKSASGIFCRAILFVIKGSIAAGLVYWTNCEGLWGSGAETEDLYYRIVATIAPVLPNAPNVNDMTLPHFESIKYKLIEFYNHAVFKVMNTIIDATTNLQKHLQDALFPCDENNKNETTTPIEPTDAEEQD